jgi:hypothetical protein
MSADAWLSMTGETTETTRTTSPDAISGADLMPRPLEEGERIELWLAGPEAPAGNGTAAGADTGTSALDGDAGEADFDGWDVRPAQVSAIAPPFVAVAAGGWGMTGEPGTRVILRRLGGEGLAEWEGTIATGAEAVPQPQVEPQKSVQHAAETILVIRLDPNAGVIHQRRRSPRLSVRLSPVRLVPLADALPPASAQRALDEDSDLAPVARLSDVSAHGAAIVVDEPLEMGTTVALEFELPGESDPFTVRGRVVAPAVALHGDVQPQPDGLPGFRRGIEFLGHTAGRESRRFAAVLARLLQSDASRRDRL